MASVKDRPFGKTRLDHNLDFDDKDPTKIVGRLYVHADELIRLEVLISERIEILDRHNRMRQLQHSIEQANKTNLVSRFAENLAKRKINPGANTNLH